VLAGQLMGIEDYDYAQCALCHGEFPIEDMDHDQHCSWCQEELGC
jgi:hypothetical protein